VVDLMHQVVNRENLIRALGASLINIRY
jgi:hypothetical protein